VHDARTGETQRLAGEAFQARLQREVLTLNLLHRQFAYHVLRGWEMPPIDAHLVCVIPGEANGSQQGAKSQELRILPRADDVREHSARVMIKRMPQPPCLLSGADETPHLIELGGASRRDADGA